MKTALLALILCIGAMTTLNVSSAQLAVCPGDCDGDNQITIDELILGTNILLGNVALIHCTALAEDVARIDDLIVAVNNALVGCPGPDPTPTQNLVN